MTLHKKDEPFEDMLMVSARLFSMGEGLPLYGDILLVAPSTDPARKNEFGVKDKDQERRVSLGVPWLPLRDWTNVDSRSVMSSSLVG